MENRDRNDIYRKVREILLVLLDRDERKFVKYTVHRYTKTVFRE